MQRTMKAAVVLKRLTLRGSIVGTRMDLKEALEIAAGGAVKPTIELAPLEQINAVFSRMREGTINRRIVLRMRER